MSEINWSLAPEGAEEMVQYNEKLTWRKGIKIWCFVQSKWCDYVSDWKIIATRQQQKTVADAYEWAKGKWMEGKLAICELDGELYFSDNNLRMRNLVCTYEQFESYAKEQEAKQEGEKWTHETAESEYCIILIDKPDHFGNVVILKEEWGYADYPLSSLKPIKPTMTKEQHEFLCKFSVESNNLEVIAEVESYLAKHDII